MYTGAHARTYLIFGNIEGKLDVLRVECTKCDGKGRYSVAKHQGSRRSIWLVSFMHYDLGYFDLEQKTLQPLDNPFGTRLSPMS
jgi:hypothetical protein